MEKLYDFKPGMVNHQIPLDFNYSNVDQLKYMQQLSANTSTMQVPEHLELIKCSLCEQEIDMYIDIDAEVFKRFYCVACIRNKKIIPFASKDLSVQKQQESNMNSNITNTSQTKSQGCQSNFSSPYITPHSSNLVTPKISKSKQKSYRTSIYVPCDECCSPPIITCSKYNHFLDEDHSPPVKVVNKRSWAVNNRRPWSHEQKETIFSFFAEQIKAHASIGKEHIIPLLQQHPDLYEDRTWKEIKWVYYHQLKVLEKRKANLNSVGDQVTTAFESIASGNVSDRVSSAIESIASGNELSGNISHVEYTSRVTEVKQS